MGGREFLYSGFFLKVRMDLACIDYGFECNFVTQGNVEKIIDDFKTHMEEEHGIEYSKEAIMQFVMRKQGTYS